MQFKIGDAVGEHGSTGEQEGSQKLDLACPGVSTIAFKATKRAISIELANYGGQYLRFTATRPEQALAEMIRQGALLEEIELIFGLRSIADQRPPNELSLIRAFKAILAVSSAAAKQSSDGSGLIVAGEVSDQLHQIDALDELVVDDSTLRQYAAGG